MKKLKASMWLLLLLLGEAVNAADQNSTVRVTVEDAAFGCQHEKRCVLSQEFLQRSRKFRAALNSAVKNNGLKLGFSILESTSTPLIPILLDGKKAVAGNVCERHSCSHSLSFIAYVDGRIVGIYTDVQGEEHAVGKPSPLEIGVAHSYPKLVLGGDYSLTTPTTTTKNSAEKISNSASRIPKHISIDQFHRYAALGSDGGQLVVFPAFITGTTLGGSTLCERSMGYGACDSRHQMTSIELDLSQQRAAALYDARGTAGVIICALMELQHGDNKPRLIDFRKGICPATW